MKKSGLVAFAALAIAVSVGGVVSARANPGNWCPLEAGRGDMGNSPTVYMAGQYEGHMTDSFSEQVMPGHDRMDPGNGQNGPHAALSSDSPEGNMAARQGEKNGDFVCPGRGNETGSESVEAGSEREKSE